MNSTSNPQNYVKAFKSTTTDSKKLALLVIISKYNIRLKEDDLIHLRDFFRRIMRNYSTNSNNLNVLKLLLEIFNRIGKANESLLKSNELIVDTFVLIETLIDYDQLHNVNKEIMLYMNTLSQVNFQKLVLTKALDLFGKKKNNVKYIEFSISLLANIIIKEDAIKYNSVEYIINKLAYEFNVSQDVRKFDSLSTLNILFDFLYSNRYNFAANKKKKTVENILKGCNEILAAKINDSFRSMSLNLVCLTMRIYGGNIIFEEYSNFNSAKFLILCSTQSFIELNMAYYEFGSSKSEEKNNSKQAIKNMTYINSEIIEKLSSEEENCSHLLRNTDFVVTIFKCLQNILKTVYEFLNNTVNEKKFEIFSETVMESLNLVLVWVFNETNFLQEELRLTIPLMLKLADHEVKEYEKSRFWMSNWMFRLIPWLLQIFSDVQIRKVLVTHDCLKIYIHLFQMLLAQYIEINKEVSLPGSQINSVTQLVITFLTFEKESFFKIYHYKDFQNMERILMFILGNENCLKFLKIFNLYLLLLDDFSSHEQSGSKDVIIDKLSKLQCGKMSDNQLIMWLDFKQRLKKYKV